MSKDLDDILFVVSELLEDSTIPKNVKNSLVEVKRIIEQSNNDIVKLSAAIYALQEVSEDVNLPLNAKSDIWLLQSKIEKHKESVK